MTHTANARDCGLNTIRRHGLRASAALIAAFAGATMLAACGGGGGDSAPVVNRPDMPNPPAAALPKLPLQRAQDAGNSPIVYVDGNIHVGADVAPSHLPVRLSAGHDDIAVSYGRTRDGIGQDQLIHYLEHDIEVGYNTSGLIPGIESTPPTVRIAERTTEAMRDQAIRAVQLINAALPRDWQMQVSNTPAIPGTAPPTDSDILIQFLPREEWPGELPPGNPVGIAARHNTLGWVDGQYQIITRSVNIFVDHTRSTGQHRMDTLVHEIIHALGRDHPDPALFPHTIMLATLQSHDSHILYPLDREALLAVYSRLRPGSTVTSLAQDLGPWSATSTHLRGDFSAGGEDVSFGVALRNGLAQPWATGPSPLTDLADNTELSGTASWSGRLLGFTPAAQPVVGAADLIVGLHTLDGDLEFTELEQLTAGEEPGSTGNWTTWNDGALSYTVDIRGNTFTRTGGDDGIVTGAFLGTEHQAMGGTLQRDDLSAAFGGSRD